MNGNDSGHKGPDGKDGNATCDWAHAQLSLLLYGELSFDDEEKLDAHVAACAECRERGRSVLGPHDRGRAHRGAIRVDMARLGHRCVLAGLRVLSALRGVLAALRCVLSALPRCPRPGDASSCGT